MGPVPTVPALANRRDIYDVRGRVAHEALFDTLDGSFRAPSTQQGYSPFSTWARGLHGPYVALPNSWST